MKNTSTRVPARPLAVAALALAPLTLAACSGSSSGGASSAPPNSTSSTTASTGPSSGSTSASPSMATQVTSSNTWAKAADSGMSAAFGTVKNTGATPVVITGVAGDAGPMQLHVTVKTAQGMEMKETKAFTVPAGGSLTLAPGGSHLMFMNLTKALKAGDVQKLAVTFQDGSTAHLTFPVRAYDGAKEKYSDAGAGSGSMSMSSTPTSSTPMNSMPMSSMPQGSGAMPSHSH